MKRSSSTTKENGIRNMHKKMFTGKRQVEVPLNALSSTQTFFPSHQNTEMNTPTINPK